MCFLCWFSLDHFFFFLRQLVNNDLLLKRWVWHHWKCKKKQKKTCQNNDNTQAGDAVFNPVFTISRTHSLLPIPIFVFCLLPLSIKSKKQKYLTFVFSSTVFFYNIMYRQTTDPDLAFHESLLFCVTPESHITSS